MDWLVAHGLAELLRSSLCGVWVRLQTGGGFIRIGVDYLQALRSEMALAAGTRGDTFLGFVLFKEVKEVLCSE